MDVRALSAKRWGDGDAHSTERGVSPGAPTGVPFNYLNPDEEVYEDLEDEHDIDEDLAAVEPPASSRARNQRQPATVSQLDFGAIFKHHTPKPPAPRMRLPGAVVSKDVSYQKQ